MGAEGRRDGSAIKILSWLRHRAPQLKALAFLSFELRFAFDLMEQFSSGATTAILFQDG